MPSRLSNQQQRLLAALKYAEKRGVAVSVEDLSKLTDYSPSTVSTYIGKRLLGRYLFKADAEHTYKVRGLVAVTDDDFAAVMTQKATGDDLDAQLAGLTQGQWARAVTMLIKLGGERGYGVETLLARLLGPSSD